MIKAFGSFGSKIWSSIKSSLSPIRDALGFGEQAGVALDVGDLQREFRKVIRLEGIAEQLASLGPGDYVPQELYQEWSVPMNRPFAYEVTLSGRDLVTGRFARAKRRLTFSRQLTTGEIIEEAVTRFSGEGSAPQFSFTHLSVTAAWIRPGEQPF